MMRTRRSLSRIDSLSSCREVWGGGGGLLPREAVVPLPGPPARVAGAGCSEMTAGEAALLGAVKAGAASDRDASNARGRWRVKELPLLSSLCTVMAPPNA